MSYLCAGVSVRLLGGGIPLESSASPWDAKILSALLEAVATAAQGLGLALNPCIIFSVASLLCAGSREAADSNGSAGERRDALYLVLLGDTACLLIAGRAWLGLRSLFIPATFQDVTLLAGACVAHMAANAIAEALVPGAAAVGFGASLAPVILMHLTGARTAATKLCATLAIRMAAWLPILNILLDLILCL